MKTRNIHNWQFNSPEDFRQYWDGVGSVTTDGSGSLVLRVESGTYSTWPPTGKLPYFLLGVRGDEYQFTFETELTAVTAAGSAQVWWGLLGDTSNNVWYYYQAGILYTYKVVGGTWTGVSTVGAVSLPIKTRIVWQAKGGVFTWQRWSGSAWVTDATQTLSVVPDRAFMYCNNWNPYPVVEGRFDYVTIWADVADCTEGSLTLDKRVPQETSSLADKVNLPKFTGSRYQFPTNQTMISLPGLNYQQPDQEVGPEDRSSFSDNYGLPIATGQPSHGGRPVTDAVVLPGPYRGPADSLDTPETSTLGDSFKIPTISPIRMGGEVLPRTFRYLQSPYHGYPDAQPAHIRGHGPSNLIDKGVAVVSTEPFAWSDSVVDGDGKTFLQSWDIRGILHYDAHNDPWYAPTPGDGFYGYGRDGQFYVDGSPAGPALNGTSFGTLLGGYNRKTWMTDVEPSAVNSQVTNPVLSMPADNTIRFVGAAMNSGNVKAVSSQQRWCLIGDFDIQVNFANYSGSGGTDGGLMFMAHLERHPTNASIPTCFYVRRWGNTVSGRIDSNVHINGGTGYYVSLTTSVTSGKMRLVRVGTTVSTYYDIGAGWVLLRSGITSAVLGTPMWITFYMDGYGGKTSSGDFSAFTINSGTTVNTAGWYREAAGVNRGNMAAFPNHTAVVDTAECVSIIDLDTNKVWMRFIKGANNALHTWSASARPFTAAMSNGRLVIADGDWSSNGAGIVVDFTSDNIIQHRIDGDAATGGFLRSYDGFYWGSVGYNARDVGPVGVIACRNLGGGYSGDYNRYRIQGNNVWDVDVIEDSPDWYYWAVATNLGLTLFAYRRHWNDGDGNQGKNLWSLINVKHATGDHVYWAKFNPATHDLFYSTSTTVYRVSRTDWLAAIAGGPDNGNLTPTNSLAVPGTSYPNLANRYGIFYGNDLLIANGDGVWSSTWPGAWTLLYGTADSAAVHKILPRGWTIFASCRLTESHAGTQELLILFLRRENQGMLFAVKLTTNMPWAAKAKYDGSIYPLTIVAAD